jgi:hypothetical protein
MMMMMMMMMMIVVYSCELIALGNGTACRETELYLSDLIRSGWFHPLDVKFTIVNEQGASIYSCSSVAQKEFPRTDPNVISASNYNMFSIDFSNFVVFLLWLLVFYLFGIVWFLMYCATNDWCL